MILLRSSGKGAALDPLSILLPLALAGFASFDLISMPWMVQLYADQSQASK